MANFADSDFSYSFTITNIAGTAQNVSAWTFEVQWYKAGGGSPVYTLTNGITFVDDGADGQCNLVLTAAQAKVLGPGVHRPTIWRTDSSNRLVIARGEVALEGPGFATTHRPTTRLDGVGSYRTTPL